MVTTTAKFDRKSWALTGANSWYYNRRIWVLSRALANAIPGRGTVLPAPRKGTARLFALLCGGGQVAVSAVGAEYSIHAA